MPEPLEPIGFWSYTSSDDTHSGGRLSGLRRLLADELQLLTGRRKVHIFQDATAIPYGVDWLKEIHAALDRSSFLLPIVTPTFLQSEMCCLEVMRFRQREQELGRDDLIFPFRYIDIADIEPYEVYDPAVLALLKSRQWVDFAALRYRALDSEGVAAKLGMLASSIRAALRRTVAPGTPAEPAAQRRPEPSGPAVLGSRSPPPVVPPTVMREGPGPEMVLVPAGCFLMGASEAESKREGFDDNNARPQHQVTIARPFWLGKYPVTRSEYATFAAEAGRSNEEWASTQFPQDGRHPVVNVTHADAEAYLAWLSQRTGQTYRLPSEAEWEYAARAGSTTARYWGENAGKPGEHAHFGQFVASVVGTRRVGSFRPNIVGLYDMLGNVWEWTTDHWHADYNGAPPDGSTWTADGSTDSIIRGGSWYDDRRSVRAAYRNRHGLANRAATLGFRCARVLG